MMDETSRTTRRQSDRDEPTEAAEEPAGRVAPSDASSAEAAAEEAPADASRVAEEAPRPRSRR